MNNKKMSLNESRTGIEFRGIGIGIGIGFLSNANNICLWLMVAKWDAKKEKTDRRKQEENMTRCLQCLRNLTAANRETVTATETEGDR